MNGKLEDCLLQKTQLAVLLVTWFENARPPLLDFW